MDQARLRESDRRPGPRRGRGDAGATVVEYAIVLAFLVVASLGAIQAFDSSAREEVGNQEDCISRRPPPPSCQLPAVPPPDPPPPDPGDPPPEQPPPGPDLVYEASYANARSEPDGPGWAAVLDVSVTSGGSTPDGDPTQQPAEGITVQYAAQPTSPPGPVTYVRCTTGSDGSCELRYPVPDLGAPVDTVRLTPYLFDTDPPLDDPPPALDFTRP